MPQSSAEKTRMAQEARRKAAERSAANRRARSGKAVAPAPVSTPAASAGVGQGQGQNGAPAPLFSQEDLQVDATASAEALADTTASEEAVEELCELVETNPTALGPQTNSVRQLCRNRRQALATRGKAAIPGKKGTSGSASVGGMGLLAYSASSSRGRDIARQRRAEKATIGRGSKPKARPSRQPRKKGQAPAKVEEGTTLAGQPVTGTQVERTISVTGNEQGTCRSVTGTEYIGSEQFSDFCGTQPEANAPKVGVSLTGQGEAVTGTEVGRSENVTGDESGSCVSVTGSEYVGAEKMADFCGITPSARPSKVISSRTEEKQMRVTGVDEARINQTTGSEAGSGQAITGDQYAAGGAKLTINGPKKVALTHTIAGQSVTGTEVGRSAAVTGDEHGSDLPVTGTEYLSNEHFASVHGTAPEPNPAKVGVDNTLQGQRITGALVDRTEKVTGNEPGSCAHLTGTQYGQSRLCGGVAPKVQNMQTLGGSNLTGTGVDLSPKMTGDEQVGCLPVTGTEYYGQQQYVHCPSTPPAAPAKVGVDHTPKGEHVSGTMLNVAENVTGNEHGAILPVSGTPYAGVKEHGNADSVDHSHKHDHGACCDACAARDAAKAAGIEVDIPCASENAQVQAQPVQPQYQAPVPQQYPVQQAVPMAPPAAPQDFSIVSPARAAHITGNDCGGNRVTGPGDMANNRVSGTPEFRYPDMRHTAQPAPAPMMVAPAQPEVQVQQPAPQPEIVMHPQRITGEGREDGIAVTGDNWGRGPGMTGTEGHGVRGRNPSLRRAEPHVPANNAHSNKSMETPEAAPVSPVTGSSGSFADGAVITVSGGARG